MRPKKSAAPSPTPRAPLHAPSLEHRAVFYPLGFAVELQTNERAVLDIAGAAWGHLAPRHHHAPTVGITITLSGAAEGPLPPAPRPYAQQHLLSLIADADNHAFADLDGGFAFATLTRAALTNALYLRYHFLESLALALVSCKHAPALHAASVSRHGRGLLLCGESGAGKSTLSYACARSGFTYTSDDASYLISSAPTPRVAGHSNKFRFRPHSRELFPELAHRELTPRLEGKPSIEVPTSELPGILTAPDTAIHHIIVLRRTADARARLVPIKTAAALEDLRANLYPVGRIRERHIASLEALNHLPAHAFEYSDLDEATRLLHEFTHA